MSASSVQQQSCNSICTSVPQTLLKPVVFTLRYRSQSCVPQPRMPHYAMFFRGHRGVPSRTTCVVVEECPRDTRSKQPEVPTILVWPDQGTMVAGQRQHRITGNNQGLESTWRWDSMANSQGYQVCGKEWGGLGEEWGLDQERGGLRKFNTDLCLEMSRLDWASTFETCSRASRDRIKP